MSLNSGGQRLLIADYVKNRLVEFIVTGSSFSQGGQGMLRYGNAGNTGYSSANGYFQRLTDTGYDSSGNTYALDLYWQ